MQPRVEKEVTDCTHFDQMDVSDIAELNLNDSVIVQTLINSDYEVEILVDYILD